MVQGLYGQDRDKPLVRLPFTFFAVGTLFLAFAGFVICIFTSLYFHFEDSTDTHCKVRNYLPSISSSFSLTPERYIWRFCIGLHSAPRFLVAAAYFKFYRDRFAKRCLECVLTYVALACTLAENLGLLLLTYVSSTETYHLHKSGFIMFVSCSLAHMLITCWLWRVITRYSLIPEETTSSRMKNRLFILNVVFCLLSLYFFKRHNMYCEPGVYTFFALCEYLMVLSNMGFNMTAYWDFRNKELTVTTVPEDKRF
ncbi:post-GPI attachment to proteins factor 2 [Scleropages formosus]|uniref:Acyltransferase PGAP2 n=2 Tax=Scleropages formosus TaxID=113540 RepID=A0A8C9SEQ6_SCLFO|nr:post-GPI attachment to proteins factor 2 [Scleropages formosus]XP_018586127.1 post-GPI attachment to proteins factor 2 [Scleropages formosus]XP_018586128.1 post-GPI attachment to proteins factor 2 [Scleropages formosus]